MFGYRFFHNSVSRYVSLFGTLFNEIYIERLDPTDNSITRLIKVPIVWGPRDKALARANSDPDLNRPWSAILPFMSFKLHSFYYDGDRHLNKLGRVPGINAANKNIATNVYNPVPYNFNFELQVNVKSMADGVKIVEQIVPWFTPDFTTTIRIIDDPEILIDIPVILNPVDLNDTWEGNLEDERLITFTLSFQLKGFFYGPVRKDKIIKVAKIRAGLLDSNGAVVANSFDTTYTITPGLTANGTPTSNASISLDYSDIDWDDDYGFIEDIE